MALMYFVVSDLDYLMVEAGRGLWPPLWRWKKQGSKSIGGMTVHRASKLRLILLTANLMYFSGEKKKMVTWKCKYRVQPK